MPSGGNSVDIDSIMLNIDAESKGASDSIDDVCKHLEGLKSALTGMQGKTQALRNIANALHVISQSKVNLTPITNQLQEFSKLNLKNTGLTQLVGNLQKLSTVTGQVDVKVFGDFAEEMNKLNDVSSSSAELLKAVNSFTRSSEKMKEAAANFPALSAQIQEFFTTMSNVTVSDSTVRMAEALADIARNGVNANSEMKRFSQSSISSQKAIKILDITIESIKDGFKQLGKILMGLTTGIKNFAGKAVEGVKSLASKIKEMVSNKGGVETLHISLKSLFTTLIGFHSIRGLFSWTKDALEAGGALTEVNHIVESMYGDMSDSVKAWADTMIDRYGIASMQAKQYAGTLTAMSKAAGVATDQATEIGLKLTEAAGDISAFFNIDTADAYQKLQSGLAGQVRPLRSLGIDLTAATLKQFAFDEGIEKSYTDMTQAEKIMLRYNYIMKVLSSEYERGIGVLGDYERTMYSYENSLRKLTAYMEQIKTQIGAGFTAAIRPALVVLNELMAKLLKAAKAFTTFMQTLFPFENGASGMALADTSEYAEDLAEGTNDAADGLSLADTAAKKLKKDLSVLPFDELNQLNKDREQVSTSDKSVGGTDAIPSLDTGGLLDWDGFMDSLGDSKVPDAIDAWAKRIRDAFERHDWEGLGTELATGINNGIEWLYKKLDPKEAEKKIDPFVSAFTTALNSLIDGVNFYKLGGAIGEGMTIVFNTANSFMERFNWTRLGEKLGEGSNGLIDNINWNSLGRFFGNKINALWRTAYGFVSTFNWEKLGKGLATGANALVKQIDFDSMVGTISTGLNGITKTVDRFARWFDWYGLGKKLAKASNDLISQIDLYSMGLAIGSTFTDMWIAIKGYAEDFDWLTLGRWLGTGVNGLNDGISWDDVSDALTKSLNGAFDSLASFAITADWTELVDNITSGINKFIRDFKWKENGEDLNTFLTNLIDALIYFLEKTDWKGFGEGIAEMIQTQEWVTLLPKAAKAIMDALAGLLEGLKATAGGAVVSALVKGLAAVVLVGKFDNFITRIATILKGEKQVSVVGNAITSLFTKALGMLSPVLTPIAPALGVISGAILAAGAAIIYVEKTGDKNLPEISKKVKEIATDCETASTKLDSLQTDAESALAQAQINVETNKRLADPFITQLETLATKTGALTEAEKTQKTEAIDKLIEIYPDLNGLISDQDTNLSSVVETVKQYITNTEAMARSQVYFEQIKKEIEGQVTAEQSLKEAQEAREPLIRRQNAYNRQSKTLMIELAEELGVQVSSLGTTEEALANYGDTMVGVNGEVKPFAEWHEQLYNRYKDNNAELSTLNSAIATEEKAIADSQERVTEYTEKMNGMSSATGKAATNLSTVATNTGTTSTQIGGLSGVVSGAKNMLTNMNTSLKTTYERVQTTGSKAETASQKISTLASNVSTAATNTNTFSTNTSTANTKTGFWSTALGTAATKAKTLADKAKDAAEKIKTQGENADTAEGYVSNYNSTNEKTPSLFATVSKLLGGVLTTLLASYGKKSDFEAKLKDDVEGAEDGIKNNSYKVEDAAKTMGTNAKDALNSEEMVGSFSDAGGGIVDAVASGMNDKILNIDTASYANDLMDGFIEHMEGLYKDGEKSTMWILGHNLIQTFANGMSSVSVSVPKVVWDETYTRMWTGEKSYVDIPNYKVKWEWYKKGGLFTDPSIIGVGEAGKETVLPLENKRTMGMIADAIIGNSGGLMDENALANAVASGYVRAMMANQGNQQQPIFNIVVKTENDEVLARAVTRGQQSIDYRNNPTPRYNY